MKTGNAAVVAVASNARPPPPPPPSPPSQEGDKVVWLGNHQSEIRERERHVQ